MNIIDGIPIITIKPHHCFIIILSLFLVLPASLSTGSSPVDNESPKFFVGGSGPGNYSTIQEAIDTANPGDTIFVFTGIYIENIVINKSIYLIGEDKYNTIIKNHDSIHTVYISSTSATLSNFTIKGDYNLDYYNASVKFSEYSFHNTITNCNLLDNYYGIWLYSSKDNNINNCTFSQNIIGLWVHHMSNYNTIHDCIISNNSESGIYFCCTSARNTIYCNTISFNDIGAKVDSPVATLPDFENTFYLNNFIDNSKNARNSAVYKNFWDNGFQGNYWSDYDEENEGAYDNDSNGVIDSPYVLSESQGSGEADNYDNYPLRYPLIHPYGEDTIVESHSLIDGDSIYAGTGFTLFIEIDPAEAIAGVQFDLSFDPVLFQAGTVYEGSLFYGSSTYFNPGTVDNMNGTIKDVYAVITTPGNNATHSGEVAFVNFTAIADNGTSWFNLSNVVVGHPDGSSVPITIINSSVTIIPHTRWDVNQDDRVNILDLIFIGQHWGKTGAPCWIPADVTCEGVVNILDMILVGQHWTG